MTTMMTDAAPGELTLTRPRPRAATAPGQAPSPVPAATRSPVPETRRAAEPGTRRAAEPDQQDLVAALQAAASSLSVAIIEIFGGTRAPSSVGKWVAPDLFERIREHAAYRQQLAKAAPPRPAMLSASTPRVCLVGPRVAEAAVVVSTGRRHRAVALRLEHIRNRWLVTQLETA
ncbi:Rv3235 family protein [Brevibacterium gallinarum]|uniref:Energy transducer TonB n=1 Tax=Brevibacterium gallinarum TaxID=2762220 RepID=A0ABR8WWX9_9MICO|nr:Rv3235 family protein [Brevibacterium gallinarum]MBD8021096.1 energy transducer TonB [Brevibacterium gallinarum]